MNAYLESEMHALGFWQRNLEGDKWESTLPGGLIVKEDDGLYRLSVHTEKGWQRTYGFPAPLAAAVAYKLLKPSLL